MSTVFGSILRELRKRRDLTLEQVAALVGVTYPAVQQWESGKTYPGFRRIRALSSALRADVHHLSYSRDNEELSEKDIASLVDNAILNFEAENKIRNEGISLGIDPDLYVRKKAHQQALLDTKDVLLKNKEGFTYTSDLIHIGETVASNNDADFILGNRIIDYVQRPPGLRYSKAAFGIYVPTECMSPKFELGEVVFVDETIAAKAGDYAIIAKQNYENDFPQNSYLRRIIEVNGTEILVSQFNPQRYSKFSLAEDFEAYRIVPVGELFQI